MDAGRLSVDGVELAEPHTPLWFAIQAAAGARYREGTGVSGMAGAGVLGGVTQMLTRCATIYRGRDRNTAKL